MSDVPTNADKHVNQILLVYIASHTQEIQSSDWYKRHCVLWHHVVSSLLLVCRAFQSFCRYVNCHKCIRRDCRRVARGCRHAAGLCGEVCDSEAVHAAVLPSHVRRRTEGPADPAPDSQSALGHRRSTWHHDRRTLHGCPHSCRPGHHRYVTRKSHPSMTFTMGLLSCIDEKSILK